MHFNENEYFNKILFAVKLFFSSLTFIPRVFKQKKIINQKHPVAENARLCKERKIKQVIT